ncbi:MAG TPA: BamA/TamA family outer membrane protein [Bryobacteraceae bacterium]
MCSALAVDACKQGEGTVKVNKLSFTGLHAVKVSELRGVLATAASSKFPWRAKHYFSRTDFEADLKRIPAFYHDRGYPDAKVRSFDVTLNNAQDAVNITLDIDEGQPVIVQAIEFNGFDAVPAKHLASLKQRIPLKVNAALDLALAQATRETALDELKDHGYPYASVTLTKRQGNDARSQILTLTATPGTLAHYGAITIEGNHKVSNHVIERQLLFRPGSLFRLSEIQSSQRRLFDLQTFHFANIVPNVGEGQEPAVVPMKVTVTESKPRQVNFGVGYGSEEKLRGTIDWRNVNFMGGARMLELQSKYSSLSKGVRMNFREPYVFSPHYDALSSIEYWHDAEPSYTLNTEGGRVVFERAVARPGPYSQRVATTTMSMTYTNEYQNYRVSQEALSTPSFTKTLISLGLNPLTGEGHGDLSSIAFDTQRSTADSTVNAQHGYTVNLHLEQSGRELGGSFEFVETILEGRYYLPLPGGAELAVRARGGSIGSIGGPNLQVPFFRRYWLGGATSLRGWGLFEVAPLANGLPIGGHTVYENSLEVHVPIWGNLSGVLFEDDGNVWNNAWAFNLGDLRYDVGPGLRYQTPIGPIRIDLGYQLNPIAGLLVNGAPQTRRYRIHFSIGQAF